MCARRRSLWARANWPLKECFRTRKQANHFGLTITLNDKSSLHSQALASSEARGTHNHSRTKVFLTHKELGHLQQWANGSLAPVAGRVSAALGWPASWHTGPAPWRAAVSKSLLYQKHPFPKTEAVPGHGRMTEDLAIAVETESLEAIRPLPKWQLG